MQVIPCHERMSKKRYTMFLEDGLLRTKGSLDLCIHYYFKCLSSNFVVVDLYVQIVFNQFSRF